MERNKNLTYGHKKNFNVWFRTWKFQLNFPARMNVDGGARRRKRRTHIGGRFFQDWYV